MEHHIGVSPGELAGTDDEIIGFARGLVSELGVQAAATKLGIARPTLASALGGLPITRGSRAAIELAYLRSGHRGPTEVR